MNKRSIQYLLVFAAICSSLTVFAQVGKTTNPYAQIAADYMILDTCQSFETLHKTCCHIIQTAQKHALKGEEIRGIVELQLLFEAFIKPDSLVIWLPLGEKKLADYQPIIRPTLYDSLIVRQNYHSARLYHLMGNYQKALETYIWLWDRWESQKNNYSTSTFYTDMAMRWCAEVYFAQGKYAEANVFLWRSLKLYETTHGDLIPDQRVLMYTKIAEILTLDGQIEEADKIWKKTYETIAKNNVEVAKFPFTRRWAASAFCKHLNLSLQNKNITLDSCFLLLKKVEELCQIEKNSYLWGEYHYNAGLFYHNKGDYKESIEQYNKAFEKFQIDYSSFNNDYIAKTLLLIAKETKYLNSDAALIACQKLLNFLDKNFKSNNPNDNPNPNRIDLKKYLSEGIALKTAIFLQKAKENPQNPINLEAAMQCGKYQMDLLENMRSIYSIEADKLTLITNAYHSLEKVWETYLFQYEKTKNPAILQNLYAEQTKAKGRVLLESLSDAESLKSSGLNSDEINELFLLKSKAASLQKNIFQIKENDPTLATLYFDYSLATQKHQAYRTKLEQTHPRLQKQKAEANSVSVAQVQQGILDENTALIEYFVGDSAIFVFIIGKNTYQVHQIARPADLDKNILKLLKTVTNSQTFGRSDYNAFAQWSDYFYQLLLAAPLTNLSAEVTHLIVIADGQLGKIPFEILGKNDISTQSFKKYPYLLRQFSVSYATSSAFLLQQKAAENTENNRNLALFASFAPKYSANTLQRMNETRGQGYDLPEAAKEATDIATLLQGHVFLAENANVETFQKEAPKFRILLLAMHAIPDWKQPNFSKLLFTHASNSAPESAELTTLDILQMDLSTDLIVLSACQTGLGQIRNGEGMLSLTRGFLTVGVKSVVMSLWKVPDATTYTLMVSFFKNLQLGLKKDEALRAAKLDYLDNLAPIGKENPCFWAGFVITGSISDIKF
jgi:CHAT domain-containing protein